MNNKSNIITAGPPFVGALSDVAIRQLCEERFISGWTQGSIRPSSIDVHIIPEETWQISCAFMPSKNKESIHQTLKNFNAKKIGRKNGTQLFPGKVYVAKVVENINLTQSPGVFARANPKSTTGRSAVHAQLIADYTASYDSIMPGTNGELYVMFRLKSFPIVLPDEKPISLNQVRFFQDRREFVTGQELRGLLVSHGILNNYRRKTKLQFSDVVRGHHLELSLALRGLGDVLGYVAKKKFTKPMIWAKDANHWDDFFEALDNVVGNKGIVLEKGRFYILSSREGVYVPIEFACEMAPFADILGEFRAHFAGYIDNDWGKSGPRPLTLELIANENMRVYHGQAIAHLMFDKMYGLVEKGYEDTDSNYVGQQTALLGKFFKAAA